MTAPSFQKGCSMTGLDKFYLGCAIFGGILFLLRIVLMLIGADGEADLDADMDADFDADSPDSGMGLFSLHSVTSFFVIFGLTGLTCTQQAGMSPALSSVLAFVAGLVMMLFVAWMFAQLYKLRSSGNINLKNAIGLEGTTYLNIPSDGIGKVQIVIQDRMRIYEARSTSNQTIETGDRVKVLSVLDNSVLSVEKL